MRIVLRCPDAYVPERMYIADLLLSSFLGLEHRVEVSACKDVHLTMEDDPEERRVVLADVLFQAPARDWLSAQTLPRLPLPRWDVGADLPELAGPPPLPVVFSQPGEFGELMRETASGVDVRVDLFGSAFFLLTRYEEIADPVLDAHDRFLMHASIAHKEGFLHRPIVNEYVDVLYALLKRQWPQLSRRARSSRTVVTHDVDVPLSVRRPRRREYMRTVVGDLTNRRDPALALRRLNAYRHKASPDICDFDPAYTFDFFLRENERHGIQSWVNFMTETIGHGTVPYSLVEPWARSLLKQVHERGHQIGFHPSFDTYTDAQQLGREFELLRSAAAHNGIEQERWGGRQHWLRWANPITWQLWDDLGLAMDSSLAYDLEPGFRCSVCYPFRVFNLKTRKALALEEWPLTWMDVTLIGILDLGLDEAVNRAGALHAECKRHNGDFVILWHNDSLVSKRQQAAYVELLDLVA